MPFRASFECLWCGDAWTTRGPVDLEGWAHLCPACLGRAGSNAFLTGRLRAALAERAAATGSATAAAAVGSSAEGATGSSATVGGATDAATAAAASSARPLPGASATALPRRAAPRPSRPSPVFPDDWFLRRGPFERGPLHDTAWAAELDAVTRWLDAQPLAGRILEPAAGVGFFSPLLAEHGELHAADADGTALDVARQRLVAHRLLAHLHPADPWSRPSPQDAPYDALVATFLLGRVRGAGIDPAAAALRARLRVGGWLAVIDLRRDPAGGPPPGIAWTYHDPEVIEASLARAGFVAVEVALTGRFFITAAATAG